MSLAGESSNLSFNQEHLVPLLDLHSSVHDLTGYIECNDFIAEGGSGTIYKGTWRDVTALHAIGLDLPPKVAVKIINLPLLTDDKEKNKRYKRIKRELELWGRIDHDHILPLVGIARMDDDANRPAFIAPWMENGNVMEFLKRTPSFPVLRLLTDIMEGLNYLHSFDPEIVHGDIKAANVLINHRMEAVICDFGLSRFSVDSTLWKTSATQANGTLRWMAPELLDGEVAIPTKASDIYAYAMTCYEILSGHVPFPLVSNDTVVMLKVLRGHRPDRIFSCQSEIWDIIIKCWAEDPTDRPSAREVLDLFQHRVTLSMPTAEEGHRLCLASFNSIFSDRGYIPAIASKPYAVGSFAVLTCLIFVQAIGLGIGPFNERFEYDLLARGSLELAMAVFSILGLVISPRLADKFGRQKVIAFFGIILTLGALFRSLATRVGWQAFGSVTIGFAIGSVRTVVPIYLAEIAPPSIRGRMIALHQWGFSWGLLVESIIVIIYFSPDGTHRKPSPFYMISIPRSDKPFRFAMGCQAMIAVVWTMASAVFPESPRWLFDKGREGDALQVLADLHGKGDRDDEFVQLEYQEIKHQVYYEKEKGNKSSRDLLRTGNSRRTFLGAMLQIWSLYPVAYFITSYLFELDGVLTLRWTHLLMIESILILTFTVPTIIYVDKWGRRPLLLIGSALIAVLMLIAGGLQAGFGDTTLHNTVRATIFLVCFYLVICSAAVTMSVSQVYFVELYPLRIRGKAPVVALVANAFCTMTTNIILKYLSRATGMFIFGILGFIGFIHIYFMYPETAATRLEEIEDVFKHAAAFSTWKRTRNEWLLEGNSEDSLRTDALPLHDSVQHNT